MYYICNKLNVMNIIPKNGSWISVIKVLPQNILIDPLTVLYAIPTETYYYPEEYEPYWYMSEKHFAIHKFVSGKLHTINAVFKLVVYRYLVKNIISPIIRQYEEEFLELIKEYNITVEPSVYVKTKYGKFKLFPWEYNVVKDINVYYKYAQEGIAKIVFLNKFNHLEDTFNKELSNYLNKGYTYLEAINTLIGTIHDCDSLYFEMRKEYIKIFFSRYDFNKNKELIHSRNILNKETFNFFYK